MGIYKKSTIISLVLSIVALSGSFFLQYRIDYTFGNWLNNICIGILSSGILTFVTSLIGYCKEERRTLHEYHWKLSELKYAVIELGTITHKELKNGEPYYDGICKINMILKHYFALVDTDFFFYRRKKIQKVFEIQTKLYPLVSETDIARDALRVFLNGKRDENGERIYKFEDLKKDMKGAIEMFDNFDNTGKLFAIWLLDVEREFGEVVFGLKPDCKD